MRCTNLERGTILYEKKTFIALFIILYLSASAANWEDLIFGGRANIVGFALSLLLACALLASPFFWMRIGEKRIMKLSLSYTGWLLLSSIFGVLIIDEAINSDAFFLVYMPFIAPFDGLSYLLENEGISFVLIALSLLCSVLSAALLFKKKELCKGE